MKIKLLAALTISAISVNAQWNYDASGVQSMTSSFKDIGKKATVINTNYAGTALDADNDNSAPQNIGFNFKFNGQTFSQFVLNTNGFIKLGTVAPSSTAICYQTATGGGNSTITAKDSNLLYPFNRNLLAEKGAEFKVATSGSDGSRVCTIQFKNLSDKIGQYASVSFQIKLYEGTNVIDFVYDEWTASETLATLTVAAVGIKGNNVESSVNIAKGSVVKWDEEMGKNDKPYEFRNGNYSVKGPNFGNKNTSLPEAGHTYRFTPLK